MHQKVSNLFLKETLNDLELFLRKFPQIASDGWRVFVGSALNVGEIDVENSAAIKLTSFVDRR
jgi:hypothetical protein